MTLDELIKQIDEHHPKWDWLIRSNKDKLHAKEGDFFANVVISRSNGQLINFPTYGPTKIAALEGAYKRAKTYESDPATSGKIITL